MNTQAYNFFMYMIWSNDKNTENTPTLNLSGITRYIPSVALMKVQMTIVLGQIIFSYSHPSMLVVAQTVRGTKQALTLFFGKRVKMDEKQLNHPARKPYFWNRAASSPFSAMDEIISQPPTSSPPMKIWGNVGQLLYVFRVSLSPWLCSSSSTSTVTKSAPCASKIPTTLCENPHWGALLDPLMKATTLFSFTNRSINCSSGTVSWTWRPGVNRKSGGLWGAPTQV